MPENPANREGCPPPIVESFSRLDLDGLSQLIQFNRLLTGGAVDNLKKDLIGSLDPDADFNAAVIA
jgi:hypothetical protein